jgi:hypothetical protein
MLTGLLSALHYQVINHDTHVSFRTSDDQRLAIESSESCVNPSDRTLSGCFLVPSRT